VNNEAFLFNKAAILIFLARMVLIADVISENDGYFYIGHHLFWGAGRLKATHKIPDKGYSVP
jgi:hypothetical protein